MDFGKTLEKLKERKTVQGNVIPWLPSQTDILAEDWEVVE